MKLDSTMKGFGVMYVWSWLSAWNKDFHTGEPRMDSDYHAWVSAPKIKRGVRDIVADKSRLDTRELLEQCGIRVDEEGFQIMEDPGVRNDFDKTRKLSEEASKDFQNSKFRKDYWDNRVYGGMILPEKKSIEGQTEEDENGKKKSKKNVTFTCRGPLQFAWGRTMDPVELVLEGAQTVTRKCASREDTERGVAQHAVSFIKCGLFVIPFYYSAVEGKKTGVTDRDLALALRSLPYLGGLKSAANPCTEVVDCWYFQHKTQKGMTNDSAFIERMLPVKRNGVKVVSSCDDYVFPTAVPAEIAPFIDSYENFAIPRLPPPRPVSE